LVACRLYALYMLRSDPSMPLSLVSRALEHLQLYSRVGAGRRFYVRSIGVVAVAIAA
jgi:hypothetical protein